MCGIGGILNLDRSSIIKQEFESFINSMQHRGPDGSGFSYFLNEKLALGHRRLAILDLSDNGSQPMRFEESGLTIIYNGEIFNFLELKQELIKLGYRFNSNTDTEVVLKSWDMWGLDCLNKFNGMWAFAIWDEKKEELILCRDRFGIKPLYFGLINSKQFLFASETRAFKYYPRFNRQIDERLASMNNSNPFSLEGLGYTVFKDINQVLPGHILRVNFSGVKHQERWWNIKDHVYNVSNLTYDLQLDRFKELLYNACKLRLISDVPIGTALSGGLDSSVVYSLIKEIINTNDTLRIHPDSQKAFLADFIDLRSREYEYAKEVIEYKKGELQIVEQNPKYFIENVEKDTELFDAIFPSPITPIAAVYKTMKYNGISVSFDGHGVDEMLYGYLYMLYDLYQYYLNRFEFSKAEFYKEVLQKMYHPTDQSMVAAELSGKIENQSKYKLKGLRRIISILKDVNADIYNSYLPPNLPSLSDDPYSFGKLQFEDQIIFNQFFESALPTILRNFDRAGMMNSVEIRMPFLDHELVTFIFSLPMESKIKSGFTKAILRDSMINKIPESVRIRTYKVGIGDPLTTWVNGKAKDWFIQKLESQLLPLPPALKSKLYSNDLIFSEEDVKMGWAMINRELIT